MKKINKIFPQKNTIINIIYTILFINIAFISSALANTPSVPKLWLPWDSKSINNVAEKVWWDFVSTFIQYVAVIAVISLMLSWIMYLIANWEEDKTKKAKSWIIWSLVWVLISISAWGIINIINNLRINN